MTHTDFIEKALGPDGHLAQVLPGYRPRAGQLQLARAFQEGLDQGRHVVGEGPCGCHVAGQQILMFNGTTKLVENVLVGDQLMGPDSMPRTVLSLARGEQETVEVLPIKGEKWRVNLDHIITVVRIDNDRVADHPVKDWFSWSRTQKGLNKLFRVPVEFSGGREALPLDAYFLGVLLGDGGLSVKSSLVITKPDPEIVSLANEQAQLHGLHVRTEGIKHHLVGAIGNKNHPIMAKLRQLGLFPVSCEDKFIPLQYKTASRNDRLAVLAGLLDTDGHLTCGCYDFISKSKNLADDVAYVARSLGLAAYVNPCRKSSQTGYEGTYYRVSVSGDTALIPCRIPRKKAAPRQQQKSVLRTGFTVAKTGFVEPYFGFSLDKDGRYLLGDFTVTHNTGKGIAYLVPAIHHALESRRLNRYTPDQRKCVVVATAGIALQEQLVNKDLPLLADALNDALPEPFTFALLKGRANYACLLQVDAVKTGQEWRRGLDQAQLEEAARVLEWAEGTDTGDVAEVPFVPSPAVWSRFSISAEDCGREKCPRYGDCLVERARDEAKRADVVVTNFHVLFSHVRVREATATAAEPHGKDLVLPPHDLLVMDEAHEAADRARDFLGWTLSPRPFQRVVHTLARAQAGDLAEAVQRAQEEFFGAAEDLARDARDPVRLREPGQLDGAQLAHLLDRLDELPTVSAAEVAAQPVARSAGTSTTETGVSKRSALERGARRYLMKYASGLRQAAETHPKDAKKLKAEAVKVEAIAKLCARLAGWLTELTNSAGDPNRVFWVSYEKPSARGPGRTLVEARTLDVSRLLGDYLFAPCRSVWMTSATLRTAAAGGGSDFSFVKRELGVPGRPVELAVPSPFDLAEQAVMVVARGVPDSQDPRYPGAVGGLLREVVERAQGRTLVLFTSWRVLGEARKHLQGLPYRVLVQGEGSRDELVRTFREDVHSVLLGVSSMWTGVDVSGEALSCLVVEKLPFPRKGDPMVDAHQDRLGRKFFSEYSLPRAVVAFRQGVGRLIRSETDRGVVVVLDGRVCDKGYGQVFLDALPDVPLTRDMAEIGRFFAQGEQVAFVGGHP